MTLRAAVSADFRVATWNLRLALVAVVGWLAYEWGAGNETFTPWLLAKIIRDTRGASAIPITAAIGFGFTTLQQLASGFTALTGFSIFDRTAKAAWQTLRGQRDTLPGEWSGLGVFAKCALVFGLGTTAVALIQIVSTGRVGVRRHARVVVQSALLCGTMVGAIGGLVASVAVLGRNVHSLSGATEWALRVLGNPLFWVGLLLAGAAINLLRRKDSSHTND
ncbi:unannotated protein [freshwater metagenome]|uniref:Unannotated protein n=1 Tax=freshwater metagenome TaxID=449393 RepID=A0A6J7EU67_9ZZZZ